MSPRCTFIVLVSAFLLGVWPRAGASLDQVTYQALVDRPQAVVGGEVQYLVVVHYEPSTLAPTITPPSFVQFTVQDEARRTETQTDGSGTHLVLKQIWKLSPNEPGRLSIASAIVTFQDPVTNLLQNGKTDIVFVDVAAATPVADSGVVARGGTPPVRRGSWWFVALAVAGIGALVWWLSRFRSASRGVTRFAPEDEALAALPQAVALAEQGQMDRYYEELTRALYAYLEQKFAVDPRVHGTDEVLSRLASQGVASPELEDLKAFFTTADRVKFAGAEPDEDEMIRLHRAVIRFIEAGRELRHTR